VLGHWHATNRQVQVPNVSTGTPVRRFNITPLFRNHQATLKRQRGTGRVRRVEKSSSLFLSSKILMPDHQANRTKQIGLNGQSRATDPDKWRMVAAASCKAASGEAWPLVAICNAAPRQLKKRVICVPGETLT
jgi:hypothetical protein